MRYLLIFFSSFSMILSSDVSLSFDNVTNTSIDILYDSSELIGGFQFSVDGVTLTGVSSDHFGTVQTLNGIVLSFDLGGETAPIDTGGTLCSLTFENSSNLFVVSGVVLSGAAGGTLTYEGPGSVQLPADSCSSGVYDGNGDCCDSGALDCNDVCDGTASVDSCGVCGGSGPDSTTGCCADGAGPNDEAADCAGVCGGSAVDAGCGCGNAGPSGCDNVCGSTADYD